MYTGVVQENKIPTRQLDSFLIISILVLSELKRSGTPLQRILKYLVSLPFLAFLSDTILELSEELDSFRKINRNSFKPPVSEEVKDMVRRNFTREIDFYMFCRQRLHRQLLALRLPSTWRGRGHARPRAALVISPSVSQPLGHSPGAL